MEPQENENRSPEDEKRDLIDHLRERTDDSIAAIEEGGKKTFGFLKSVWFWVITIPIEAVIIFAVVAVAFPSLFVGYPQAPDGMANAKKAVLIDIDRQAAYAYENGKLMHRYVILTGRREHETPPGKYRATRKIVDYHSRAYDSPMPNSVFFIDEEGIAMHQSDRVALKWCIKELTGNNPDIGSRGCVRLTSWGSRKMFEWSEIGMPIWVTHLHGGGPETL